MLFRRSFLTAVVGCCVSSGCFAANSYGLADEDYTWLVKLVGAQYVSHNCSPDLELDFAGAMRWGDQNGADVNHVGKAVLALVQSISGSDYERSDIDAKVTRAFMGIATMLDGVKGTKKASMCKQFREFAVRDGFLKKKSD